MGRNILSPRATSSSGELCHLIAPKSGELREGRDEMWQAGTSADPVLRWFQCREALELLSFININPNLLNEFTCAPGFDCSLAGWAENKWLNSLLIFRYTAFLVHRPSLTKLACLVVLGKSEINENQRTEKTLSGAGKLLDAVMSCTYAIAHLGFDWGFLLFLQVQVPSCPPWIHCLYWKQ